MMASDVLRLVVVAGASIGLILLVAFITTRLVRARGRGLSIRLQVFIALASTVGAFAFGLGLMVLDRIDARTARFARLAATEQAELVAQLMGSELDQGQRSLADVAGRLPPPRRGGPLEGVEVYDRRGQQLYSGRAAPSRRDASPRPGEASISVEATIREPSTTGPQAVGVVRVTKTTLQLETLLKDFAPTILVISLVLGAAAALAAAWIGRTIAGPIEALSRFSERVAEGDHRATAPAVVAGREVRRLAHSLDSMRRQLEGRPFVETFAADLSHELKNPVAAIRASAEVLEESALEEPEEARRFVGRIRQAVGRIERLLSELLSLAQIEARGVSQFARLELAALVEGAVRSLDAGDRVNVDLDHELRVRGDRLWLTRALSNLVDNALIHGQGDVRVVLERSHGEVLVRVSNRGQIQQHTRDRVFGRFVTTRADKGGTGLGLAIVRAVAEAHRGQVRLATWGPEVVEFQLRLPAA